MSSVKISVFGKYGLYLQVVIRFVRFTRFDLTEISTYGGILEQRKKRLANIGGLDSRIATLGKCRDGDGRDPQCRTAGPLIRRRRQAADQTTRHRRPNIRRKADHLDRKSLDNQYQRGRHGFSVQIKSSDLRCKKPQGGFQAGDTEAEFDNRLKRSSLEVSFGGPNEDSRMHMHLKFESKPIPEGLSRIIDEYNKTIMPFTVVDETQE
ncbi:MAG: DUF2589 domain-containing protein [Alistipes sp.]